MRRVSGGGVVLSLFYLLCTSVALGAVAMEPLFNLQILHMNRHYCPENLHGADVINHKP